MNELSKKRIIFTVLAIVSIGFLIHTLDVYLEQKDAIDKEKMALNVRSQKLFEQLITEAEFTMKSRAIGLLKISNSKAKLDALRNQDPKAIRKLFTAQYHALKEQIKGFSNMHFISPDGFSIYRMHSPNTSGDDLKTFRPHIKELVTKKFSNMFFETGVFGLYLRKIEPIMDNNELIAYLELGIRPTALTQRSEDVLGLKSYFFVKENLPVKPLKNRLHIGDYFLCSHCEDPFMRHVLHQVHFENNSIQKLEGKHYITIIHDLKNHSREPMGRLLILQNIEHFYDKIYSSLFHNLLSLIISLIIIYITLNHYINNVFNFFNRLQLLLNSTNDAIYLIRLSDSMIMDVNKRAVEYLGYTRQELLKMKAFDFRKPLDNSPPQIAWEKYAERLRQEHHILSRGKHIRKDGSSFPVETSLSYIIIDNKEYLIAVARDITKQYTIEKKLEKEQLESRRLHTVLSQSSLYTTADLAGNITDISDALLNLTEYTKEEVIGKSHRIFKSPDTDPEVFKAIWNTIAVKNIQWQGEIKNITKSGKPFWIELTILPMYNEEGKVNGYYSYRQNITDKKELLYLSEHDPLTSLYNRRKGDEIIQKYYQVCFRYKTSSALVLLDIDYFKKVNDTYGHLVGDQILRDIAELLSNNLRDIDYAIRWGGEEFLIVLPHTNLEDAKIVAEKLRETIQNHPFEIVKSITCSFGVSHLCGTASIDESITKADVNLYTSKKNGRNCVT